MRERIDSKYIEQIKNAAAGMAEELTALRRHLHMHPEISWQEVETSRFIASKLEEIGLKPRVGSGGKPVGVLADLDCGGESPCLALRADIDGLGFSEENDIDYKSLNSGTMHACGHDGHIAMLLGAAKILYSIKDRISGRIRFIFQPAEEYGAGSGAQVMMEEGVLKGVDAIAGMHLWSHVPSGRVQWRCGPVMGSADSWAVCFRGKGGHGALPHQAIDPTIIAAHFILAIQSIVSRETDPLQTCVVSVGQLYSGNVVNVIPETAELYGNIRSLVPEVRAHTEEAFLRMAKSVAETYRGSAETKYVSVYPHPVNNDPALTELFREIAVQVVGQENVEESPIRMTSEDFSFYQTVIPGVFFFLGSGDPEKGTTAPHHSSRFNVDDSVLSTGVSLLTCFAVAALGKLAKV
ncbi:MAG: amidohydrolase [Synergistaceae bacterium]|nr:amidohydrolase [Synergistaceae bacterium]